MRAVITIPLGNDFDKEYGRWDFAPRIFGKGNYDGETGYLLAVNPTPPGLKTQVYLVLWDDSTTAEWIAFTEFFVISGVVA